MRTSQRIEELVQLGVDGRRCARFAAGVTVPIVPALGQPRSQGIGSSSWALEHALDSGPRSMVVVIQEGSV
jgi:hypothetical protein